MSTVIERALAKTTVLTTDPGERKKLEAERKRLTSLKEGLLPVESGAREALERDIAATDRALYALATAEAVENLPMLDPVVFTWTKSQLSNRKIGGVMKTTMNVPALALVFIDEENMKLSVERDQDTYINDAPAWRRESPIPGSVDGAYRGILRKLAPEVPNHHTRMHLTYSYHGVVPQEIRATIAEEYETVESYGRTQTKLRRFDSLAFVCEVDRWEIRNQELPRRDLDPILVGVKGGSLWVIASFDPTTLESYIASEFTS